jgi:hypothetical protein
MMAVAAKQMGYKVAVVDPVKDSPCGQIADIEITAQYIGVNRFFIRQADHCFPAPFVLSHFFSPLVYPQCRRQMPTKFARLTDQRLLPEPGERRICRE